MLFSYCPKCGEKLVLKSFGDEVDIPYCEICKSPYFDYFGQAVIVAVFNEHQQVVLLKQNYVSSEHRGLVAGYLKQGTSAEENAVREVLEETGQVTESIQYVKSYWHENKELLMLGFLVHVKRRAFNDSKEVDEIDWFERNHALTLVREGSIGKEHLENCIAIVNQK
ncbi:MAG: NUDIX domain-containing protein [Clostridia bacterium]|nr:NUDIX domain-containing protein [Clostridia bacterium]